MCLAAAATFCGLKIMMAENQGKTSRDGALRHLTGEIKFFKRAPSFLKILTNLSFLFLWLAQVLSQLGDRFFVYLLMILVYRLAAHSSLGASLPMLAFGLPAFFLGPLAGVFVDRWSKKQIMFSANFLRGLLLIGLFATPFLQNSLIWLFVFSFAFFAISQFFAPAEVAVIPLVVTRENLILANSFFMLTWMGSTVIGFGVGPPFVDLYGPNKTLIGVAVVYLLAALALLAVKVPHTRPQRIRLTSGIFIERSFWHELMMGIELLRRRRALRFSLGKFFLASSILAVVSVLSVGFTEKVLKLPETYFGYLVLPAGLGMLVGILMLHRISHRLKREDVVVIGFMLAGVVLALLGYTADLWLAVLYIFIIGVANSFVTASLQTILQEKTPRSLRGRISSFQMMMVNIAFTFPAVGAGILADTIGVSRTLRWSGLLVIGLGLVGYLAWKQLVGFEKRIRVFRKKKTLIDKNNLDDRAA